MEPNELEVIRQLASALQIMIDALGIAQPNFAEHVFAEELSLARDAVEAAQPYLEGEVCP